MDMKSSNQVKSVMGGFGDNTIYVVRTAKDEEIKKSKETKDKKGDGINSVLVLMKELRDFQDCIDKCVESQSMDEIKSKIEAFNDDINKMYEVLIDIAKSGIRKNGNGEEQAPSEDQTMVSTSSPSPVSLNVPQKPII